MGARYLGVVEAAGSSPVTQTRKKHAFACFFQLNPSWRTGEIHLRWMKSLRDEIRLRRVKRTDLISSSAKCSISSEGFARRFHRGAPQGPRNELAEFWGKGQCLDFTYHTILRLNMGCSAPAEMCFSQVRYLHPHQSNKDSPSRGVLCNDIRSLTEGMISRLVR